jgi:hypothetical protein
MVSYLKKINIDQKLLVFDNLGKCFKKDVETSSLQEVNT